MAEVVIRKLLDDIDGTEENVQSTEFTFEGIEYEIDLSQANYLRLREFIDEFTTHGRKIGGRLKSRRVQAPSTEAVDYVRTQLAPSGQSEAKLIRSWYAQQSKEFQTMNPDGGLGRVKQSIKDAYYEAQRSNGSQPAFSG